MEVSVISRKFVFEQGNKEQITLDDINPMDTYEHVLTHYSFLYPELTNANIIDKGIVDGVHQINFQSLAGTKG